MTSTGSSLGRTLVAAVVGGAFASWVKASAEAPLQQLAEKLVPPGPGEKDLVGADSAGQPDNMPPAKVVDAASEKLQGGPPSDTQGAVGSQAVHFGTGIGLAVGYCLVARWFPPVTRLLGVPAGAGLYALTHGSLVPALGLQNPPWKLPASAVIWESGSHLAYGAVLETVRRALVDAPAARS